MRSLPGVDSMGSVARARLFRFSCLVVAAVLALTAVAVFDVAGARAASLEPVGEFAKEGMLAPSPSGIAVNDKTGDVYVANNTGNNVLVFDETGKFLEAWGWGVGDNAEHYERCGPTGEPAFPECIGRNRKGQGQPGSGPGQFDEAKGVAVDEATGNVYVFSPVRKTNVVQVFTDRGELITAFGKTGQSGEESEIEEASELGAMAVNDLGEVFIYDEGSLRGPRLVVFKPQSPTEYVFAKEVSLQGKGLKFPKYLSFDSAGNLFLEDNEGTLYRFSATDFAAPAWQHDEKQPEMAGVTSDPSTGEVYWYSPKTNLIHRVKPVGGEGVEEQTFPGGANQEEARVEAFDPSVKLGERPLGVLYAIQPLVVSPLRREQQGFIFAEPVLEVVNPPTVDEEAVTKTGVSSAGLAGEIDPHGFETEYTVELGTAGPCGVAPCSQVAGVGGELPDVAGDREAAVSLTGLAPDTTYFYRFRAENQYGSVFGSGGSFRTFPVFGGGLPDGRAYELVSPAEKHGGEVIPLAPEIESCVGGCEPGRNSTKMPVQSTPSGEAIAYEGLPFFPGEGAIDENEYVATRTPTGWTTKDVMPASAWDSGGGYMSYSAESLTGVYLQTEPALVAGGLTGYEDLYRVSPDGVVPLLTVAPPHRTKDNNKIQFVGATKGYDRIFFTFNDALTGETAVAPPAPLVEPEEMNLYEWHDGVVSLVNVLPGNAGAVAGVSLGSGTETAGDNDAANAATNAISVDGSRVFWSDTATGQVYVRENATETTQIPDSGHFLAASSDGGRVLLDDGHAYDLETKSSTDHTQGQKGFLGTIGASSDLSRVYFVDTAVLPAISGPNSFGESPTSGGDNLYLYDGRTGSTAFIATLNSKDDEVGEGSLFGDWKAAPDDRMAQVTIDGGYAAFESIAPIDPSYNNNILKSKICGQSEHTRCYEVYEYDAETGKLVCASCDPTGARPRGESWVPVVTPIGLHPGQPSFLAENGRLYFDSFDTLSAGDLEPGVENVYEYERGGQGSCGRAEGCIEMLSSGSTSLDSSFMSADASGANVFIATRERLLPNVDSDELVDLYDVREGGGFSRAPSAPPRCEGERCRPGAVPAPMLPVPLTSTFEGLGDLSLAKQPASKVVARKKAARCPKGKQRIKHRCVKGKHARGRGAAVRNAARARGRRS